MSKIYKYTHLKDVVAKSGGAYLPGELGAVSPNDVIAAAIVSGGEVVENGQFVELDSNGKTTTITAVQALNPVPSKVSGKDIFGVIIKDVHAQRLGEDSSFIYSYKNSSVSVCRTGYVWVPVQDDGTVSANGQVYIRLAEGADDSKVIGGIETAEEKTGAGTEQSPYVYSCVALEGATFTGRVGFALSGTDDETTDAGLTCRTAEVKLELGILA